MKMKIKAELEYDIEAPTDMLMQIEAAALPVQEIVSERFDVGSTAYLARIAAEDSIGTRVWLSCTERLSCRYEAEVIVRRRGEDLSRLHADRVHRLPHEAVRYLMASRYCPSDEFQSFTAAEFGHCEGGQSVLEMAEWIRTRFIYSPGASGPSTTALETFVQRRGICRDFAHVLVTLARAKAIPARIVSCYGPDVTPPDFHAVAEVWLDGRWHLVDPTGMTTPDRIAVVGVGRDAADIAFLTSYGWVTMRRQVVAVEEIA
jgi:transglutaminase-like putative cysteine protease